ncbi:MAG: 16S rRNA (guanine(527)-N(7))-methyltransferase RsmG [Robiginitomaculum sp.]
MIQAQEFQQITQVSPEVLALYNTWENMLTHWNKKINLVSPATISQYWQRHALDSHQLFNLAPKAAKNWLDMGSGGGFPGLSIAINLKTANAGGEVILVESVGKKCNFLRAVTRELNLPARIVQARIENLPEEFVHSYDVITARALAPLPKLLTYSAPFSDQDTIMIFPKGGHWEQELEAAQKYYRFTHNTISSQTEESAKILLVSNLDAL